MKNGVKDSIQAAAYNGARTVCAGPGCRKVWKSGGHVFSNVVGIICPPPPVEIGLTDLLKSWVSPDVVYCIKTSWLLNILQNSSLQIVLCIVLGYFEKIYIFSQTKHDNNTFNWLGLLLCTFTAKIISLILMWMNLCLLQCQFAVTKKNHTS